MSAKYELDGYQPLRPWQRGVSYLGFLVVSVLAYVRVHPDMPSLMIAGFMLALIVTAGCALFCYWDARVTASLRRKGARRTKVVRGFAQPPFTFFEREAEWDYYADPEPQSVRIGALEEVSP